jgi:uncharacterized Fe-S cluster-containing radical SAM superfamily protein
VSKDVDVQLAEDPELSSERSERPRDWAPYRRFRDEPRFYTDINPPGSFSGDLVGCGFACRQCWSTYGLAGKDKAVWRSPDDVADRLIAGARKHGRIIVRLSHGEPMLYPDHVVAVAERVISRSEDLTFQVETNGLWATPEVIDRLDAIGRRTLGDGMTTMPGEDSRIGVWFSVKVPDPLAWSWYTGRRPDEYEQMMRNVEYAARHAHGIFVSVGVVADMLEDEREMQIFLARVDRWRPGLAQVTELEEHKVYFPRERPIDRAMGRRRVRMAEREGFLNTEQAWSEEYLLGNNVCPPWPRP